MTGPPPLIAAVAADTEAAQQALRELCSRYSCVPPERADIIVSLGERPATSVDDLHKLLTELPVGIPASIILLRHGRKLERLVVPGEYPGPLARK